MNERSRQELLSMCPEHGEEIGRSGCRSCLARAELFDDSDEDFDTLQGYDQDSFTAYRSRL